MTRQTSNQQVLKLKNDLRELEAEKEFYKGRFPATFADELLELHKLCADLAAWAVPGQGKLIDSEGRGTPDSLSADGRSTRDGRATLKDRRTVEWAKRRIRAMSDDFRSRMDPDSRREDPRPQCWRRTPKHKRGVRLPVGSGFCHLCGGELKPGATRNPEQEET